MFSQKLVLHCICSPLFLAILNLLRLEAIEKLSEELTRKSLAFAIKSFELKMLNNKTNIYFLLATGDDMNASSPNIS